MMFKQTFSHFAHLVLYHMPQLAWLVVFLVLFQYDKFWPEWPLCCVLCHFKLWETNLRDYNFAHIPVNSICSIAHIQFSHMYDPARKARKYVLRSFVYACNIFLCLCTFYPDLFSAILCDFCTAVLDNICDIHVNSANMGAFRCLPFVSDVCLTSKGLTCERGNKLLKGLSKKGLGWGDVGRRECGNTATATYGHPYLVWFIYTQMEHWITLPN